MLKTSESGHLFTYLKIAVDGKPRENHFYVMYVLAITDIVPAIRDTQFPRAA